MTRLSWLVVSAIIVAAAGAPTLRTEHDRLLAEVDKAQRAEDWRAAHASLVQLDELLHGPSFAKWSLPMTEFRLGDTRAAIAGMRTYAAMGLTRDVSQSPTLHPFKDDPAVREVLAQLQTNAKPVHTARTVQTLTERDLITEDIAWDPRTERIFVSSVRKRKIVMITPDGTITDFVRREQDYVDAILALCIDPKGRWLWATTARIPQELDYKEMPTGRTALLKYDLLTRQLVSRIDLPCRTKQCVLGDMTISHAGDVYVSESVNGVVYRVPEGGSALEAITAPGALVSPQTPALLHGDRVLLVADYSAGIARIDLKKGTLTWLTSAKPAALDGIDGLYAAGHDLLAVQNGTNPNRVLRLKLDADWKTVTNWEVIESNSTDMGSPTHGVIAGKEFYFIGQSGWDHMSDEGPPKPGEAFEAPRVLSVPIN